MSPIYGSFKIENMGLVLLYAYDFFSTSGVFTFSCILSKKNSNLLIKKSSRIAVFI